MTSAPRTPEPVASNPVLGKVLQVGALVTGALAVIGAIIGFAVAGPAGLVSALVGVVLAALFLGITAASILIANRWNGDPLYPTLFFSIVLGGWLVKFVVFLVALFLLRSQPWLSPMVFFIALVVSILATLIVDVVVMMKMRIPYVSDAGLPTTLEETGEMPETTGVHAAERQDPRSDSAQGASSDDSSATPDSRS